MAADRAALVPALERHVLARFLEVVQEHPGSLAVTSEGVARTFGELAADVAELADRLRDRLVREGPDCSPVAVLAEQGVATMTAWLAVVAIGRPVTLLDPMLPPERWRQLLEQAGAGLLLVGGPWQADVPTDTVDTLPIGTVPVAPEGPSSAGDLSAVLARLTAAGWAEVDPSAAATIVFTSGSTGAAKGVVYTHRSVLAVAHFGAEALGIAPGDRVALVIPQSFAYGQEASLMTLLNGASLHASDVRRSGLSGVGNWFAEHRITVLHSTPSLLRAIVDTLADEEVLGELRTVVTGGEAARGRDLADR